MKRALVLIIALLLAVSLAVVRYYKDNTTAQVSSLTPTPTLTSQRGPEKTSLFVPYWTLSGPLPTSYDRLIYFGVTPGSTGIDRDEIGYQKLREFLADSPTTAQRYLTLRMLDNTQNFTILKDTTSQKSLITDTVSLAKRNDFQGIVLDLEVKALPFDSLMKQINNFVALFASEAKKQQLSFAMTVYGDTFYRVRPFDVPTLAKDSDEIMVMAYDFHKASGNPGPNFPFTGKETYGYDFKSMVDDFRKVVPSNKLTVVFGYFGYDWQTDEKGVASGSAEPLVDTEITQHFLPSCHSCVMTRDPLSGENKVTYTNTDATPHILWFEDATSVKAKQAYLQSQGITSFSDWAYSYF